ncbi:MAG TPA: CDP-diacylglycerol--glycerol-3-phosphate 3-phosphatidyltransferase [Caulobacteraceae bacterium]|nr:CDP-diacylglycerol--glycerol-3-phosphate 3-phosphatidyltransferase [Caulobacteraceae bacterium]
MKQLPNILTALRLVLSLFVFFALAAAGRVEGLGQDTLFVLERWAFAAFVVAAVTDFFDGWLARRYDVVSVAGAILDPIADKVLICAAILGLLALTDSLAFLIPAGLILFREFAVSSLREVAAGRNVKLPVTLLAKWKTTVQLVALGAQMIVASWTAFSLPADEAVFRAASVGALALVWLACVVTLITGAQYGAQAYRALGALRD